MKTRVAIRVAWGVAAAALATAIAPACSEDDGDGGAAGVGPGDCPTGQLRCGGECIDIGFDRDHCGACGVACSDETVCSLGSCGAECRGGTTRCSADCVDLDVAASHCGDCGHACQPGEVCDGAGACRLDCVGGLTPCAGSCVDPTGDPAHCGGCARPCTGGLVCNGRGTCAAGCDAGFVLCASRCIDPSTDDAFCGASGDCLGDSAGTTCAATEACTSGACLALPCEDQWEARPHANDTETSATELLSGPLGDCANQEAASGLLLGASDVDFYHYRGLDDSCIVNPRQLFGYATAPARLCAFFECVDPASTAAFSCPAGTAPATSPTSRPGCCATGSTVDFELTDFHCAGSSNDTAEVHLRIDDPTATDATCTAYTLRYNY